MPHFSLLADDLKQRDGEDLCDFSTWIIIDFINKSV